MTTDSVLMSGERPIASSVVTSMAPIKPPRLHIPWKLDISARKLCFSTTTACKLIATPRLPAAVPKINNATAIDTRLCQIVKLGSNTIKSMVAIAINGRHPQRLTKAPVAGIAIIEPIPIQSSNKPKFA